MAVAVDPAFASNHFIYLYYTWSRSAAASTTTRPRPVNRVSRFVLRRQRHRRPGERDGPDRQHPGSARATTSARDLQFGKDGLPLRERPATAAATMRATAAACELNDAARDRHVLLGKILRITRDGAIPADNPFQGAGTARCNVTGRTTAGTRCQETFAWGLRNPFRLAFDPNSPTHPLLHQRRGRDHLGGDRPRARPARTTAGTCARGSARRARPPNCGAPPAGMTNPIHAYSHEPSGCYAITGGAFVPEGHLAHLL